MPDLLIRVDANPEIALGHLKRCISLAEALQSTGVEPLLLCHDDPQTKDILRTSSLRHEFSNTRINTGEDGPSTLSFLRSHEIQSVVFDSYAVDTDYLNYFRTQGLKVICVDDLGDRPLDCDVVINGSLGAEELAYDAQHQFLGLSYCILAKPFWETNRPDRQENEVINVLITMGGIDHYGLSEKCMELLDGIPEPLEITVVVGPYYENRQRIERVSLTIRKPVELVIGSNDLFPYIEKCDMAISAGGITLYELAALKKPAIGIGLWENQYQNVIELDKKGVILGLIYADEPSFAEKLSAATAKLVTDQNLRAQMAERAGESLDGNGALHVAREIGKLIGREHANQR